VTIGKPDPPKKEAADPSATDMDAMQGWWEVVEDRTEDGTEGLPKGTKLLVEGNKTFTFYRDGDLVPDICIFVRLDATESPKHMNRWHIKKTDGSFSRAIYVLEEYQMIVAYGTADPDGRPIRFDVPASDVRTYRRCKPPELVRLKVNTDPNYLPKMSPPHTPKKVIWW
jgi:uncharacterized protein (TIGR03067 family)